MSYSIKNLALEMSLKPFVPFTEEHITSVCTEIWRHWYGLAKHADTVAMLIWHGDGTDMLEWNNNLDAPIDWGMYMGYAEKTWDVSVEDDPKRESIVGTPRVFRPDAPALTYRHLKQVIDILKSTGKEVLACDIQVGIPFEPGTEFCRSTWRYENHPEIILGSDTNPMRVIDCAAHFKADTQSYAGWPEGIPEGLDFGTFLGRQTRLYMDGMNVDYIWFSNSFGYGRSPYAWGGTGPFFDGRDFAADIGREDLNREQARAAIVDFWKAYRTENNRRIECRGTDFTTGMNIVNHAVDYRQIYEAAGGDNTMPPPNTPWPALTSNHGIALAGFLSQLSGWRGGPLPYRMYTSDPWWCNSAWFDYYGRKCQDFQLTMGLSIVDEKAAVHTANEVKFLTIDTTWGDVDEQLADDMVSQIKFALNLRPDGIAPLLWVYPWQRNHQLSIDENRRHDEVLHGDLLMQAAMNHAFPVAGAISDEALPAALAADPAAFAGRVLCCPAPEAGSALESSLLAWIASGGQVLCYGAIAHCSEAWLVALGLGNDAPISGRLDISSTIDHDGFAKGTAVNHVDVAPQLNGGGITAVASDAEVLASCRDEQGRERVLASRIDSVAWCHGCIAINPQGLRGRNLNPVSAEECYPGEAMLRHSLASLGWRVDIDRRKPDSRGINCLWSRRQDQFILAAYSADPSASLRLSTPLGIPIIPERECEIEEGIGSYTLFGSFQERVMVFVEQEEGLIRAKLISPKHFRYQNRLAVRGLENATVRVLVQKGCKARTDIQANPDYNHYVKGQPHDGSWIDSPWGEVYEMRKITGSICVGWTEKDIPEAIPVDEWDAHQK